MTASDRALPPTRWLAFALFTLPFWQLSGLDFDRSGALVLVGPALWLGRRELWEAWGELWPGRRFELGLGGVVLIAGLLSSALSAHVAASLVMTARWILLAAGALLAGRLVRIAPETTTKLWLESLVLSAAAGTLTVWALWFSGHRAPFPLYFNSRHLGYHAMLAAVAVVALITRAPSPHRSKWLWSGAGVVVFAGVFWSGGRSSMLALGTGLVALLVCSPRAALRPIVTFALALGAAGVILSPLLATSATGAADLTSARSLFWFWSWQHFLQAPLLGHGPDAYLFLVPKMDGPHPHNLVLQCLLDVGVVGTVPFLGLLGLGLYRGWRRATVAKTGGAEMSASWVALLAGGTALSLLDGPFYHLIALLPLGLAWGVCLHSDSVSETRRTVPIAALAGVLTGLAAVMLGFHTWLYFELSNMPPPPGPRALVARAWRAFPSTTTGLRPWYVAWSEQQPQAALEWTLWTADHTSDGALYRVLAARLLLNQGRREEAKRQMETALAIAHRQQRAYVQSLLTELFPAPAVSAPPSP
jgi:O-antigen ligase